MNHDANGSNLKSLIKMLGELSELAEHATLTGAMEGGTARAVTRYNEVLRHLVERKMVPEGMFTPLPADAGYGELAVDSRLLRAYVKENDCNGHRGAGIGSGTEKHLILRLAPFASSSDLHELVDSYLAQGSEVDPELVESLAPFLDSSDLGTLIRKLAKRTREVKVEVNVSQKTPEPPAAPTHPVPADVEAQAPEGEVDALVHHDVPIEDRLRALTDRMRDPSTTTEDFQELAAEVLRLKQLQKHD